MTKAKAPIVIPSSPADQAKIQNAIKQISAAMTRKELEDGYIKDTLDDIKDKFSIPTSTARTMAVDFHKTQFDERVAQQEEYSDLYEAIMNCSHGGAPESEDQE